jgi:putative ABC transport system permease protein
MFNLDNWQEIFATIKKNKLRTFLTCFGVYWGIFMLVVMMGSGNGLRNGVLSEFNGTATNSFFLWTQRTTKPYKGMQPGRDFNYTQEDYKFLQNIPEFEVVAPQNQLGRYGGTATAIRGLKSNGAGVNGVYPVINKIQSIRITEGRWLNNNDITDKRKVAVIGKRIRDVLFKQEENPIGEYVQIQGVYFRVIGCTEPSSSGGGAEEEAQTIYLPFTAFNQAFNYGDVVGWFSIKSKDGVPASEAEQKAIALLKERHKIAPDDDRAIGHWNMEVQFNKMSGLFTGIEGLVWVVGIGTLFAGIIGVSNIMLIIVKERTREIGVKRALGATPILIVGQIILESVFLTAMAGYIGLVVSVGLLELISSSLPNDSTSMFQHPGVDLNVALIALSILVGAGALAGLIPARKAIAISPVEALRTE